MCVFKSIQTKLPGFKREIAEDGTDSFSPSSVKTLRGGNSPVEALLAKIKQEDKLIKALNDNGSIVNLFGDTLYQRLGESSQIKV